MGNGEWPAGLSFPIPHLRAKRVRIRTVVALRNRTPTARVVQGSGVTGVRGQARQGRGLLTLTPDPLGSATFCPSVLSRRPPGIGIAEELDADLCCS
jgi:hypothetical protein